jgi:galactokinase
VQSLVRLFSQAFHTEPLLVRSPGRINLLGEHTDYNEGFVLPAAIDKFAYVAVQKRADNRVVLLAADLNEQVETTLDAVKPVKQSWCNYILGVTQQFLLNKYPLGGYNLAVSSNIPVGAGLSSSAALACATAYALNELFECGVDKLTLAKFAQAAEHTFAGVQCGIMDQFASLFGRKNHVILLDCRSMEYEYVPLQLKAHELVLVDSGVKHALASSAYNQRRKECEEGVRIISRHYASVKSLRDVAPEQVDECLSGHSLLHKRCKYVVEENQRVTGACHDLVHDHIDAFGKKMVQTHRGLQVLYEVSCSELDFLVDKAISLPGVSGARMMGGGFGGCTLNLLFSEYVDQVIGMVASAYSEKYGRVPAVYRVKTADGTTIVPLPA